MFLLDVLPDGAFVAVRLAAEVADELLAFGIECELVGDVRSPRSLLSTFTFCAVGQTRCGAFDFFQQIFVWENFERRSDGDSIAAFLDSFVHQRLVRINFNVYRKEISLLMLL